jgi:hypothetical protein
MRVARDRHLAGSLIITNSYSYRDVRDYHSVRLRLAEVIDPEDLVLGFVVL